MSVINTTIRTHSVIDLFNMSNLVELQNPSKATKAPNSLWDTSNTGLVYPAAPVASQSQVAVLTNEGSARNKFRENNVRLQMMFAEKVGAVEGKVVTAKMPSPVIAQQIFKPENTYKTPHDIHHNGENESTGAVDLSKGIITRIAVVSTHNDFPFPITFDFTGQGEVANCFSLDGKQFPLCLYPNEHNRGTEFEIYNAKDAVNDPFLKRYAHVSVSAMWDSIQTFKNANYVYVPIEHDAVRLIKLNTEKFGPAPTENDVKEGIYYKMDGARIANAIDELYYNIISKFKFTDLSKFQVNMSRLDGKDFKKIEGSKWDHLDVADQEFMLRATLHAGFELKVTWTFPQQEAVAKLPQSGINPTVAQQYNISQSQSYQLGANKLPVAGPRV